MRFFRLTSSIEWQSPEPTPSEIFVQREFADAIAFAGEAWRAFEAGFQKVDPLWVDKFSLAQRMAAFMAGPIGATLDERFPAIATTGAEADEMTDRTDHKWVIAMLIVCEAVIASGGGSRGEVRSALGL